jgi:tRNA pseudouridine38-40 synthase
MIVVTLVRVGTGRLEEDAPGAYLGDADNRRTGPTAPPHGLYLVGVEYEQASP